MTLRRFGTAVCLAALLSLPLSLAADDHGSGGGDVSDDRGGDHNNNGGGHDQGNGPGATPVTATNPGGTDDHGGGDNQGPAAGPVPDGNHGAGAPNADLQKTRINLAATTAGSAIGAKGQADIRVGTNEQRLKVEVEANVPDGTMFNLSANDVPIGVLTIHLGEAEFEFDTNAGQTLAGGLQPAAITSIGVTDSSGAVVLQAQFAAISTSAVPPPTQLLVHKELRLTATDMGNSVAAEGSVDLRSQGADTSLKVEVEAKVPDGTVWTVSADGVKLGSITFRLMEGELRLGTDDLLQAGLSVPSSIASIQVTDASGNPTLSGTL